MSIDGAARQIFVEIEGMLREWLAEDGIDEVDFEYSAIALVSTYVCWVSVNGQRSRVHMPSKISFRMSDLRAAQADSHRGAWLWSHLWMEASDGVLHQESDWMREPVIDDDEPVMDGDADLELYRFPRDPQWVPEWMAVKAAAHQKVKAARERRRQRDRERRARKKAEAAGAAEAVEERPGSDASSQAGE